MVKRLGIATKTSTNTYASVFAKPLISNVDQLSNFVIQYKENNVNAVTLKFLGSNDGTNWQTIGVETPVPKNGMDYEVITDAWLYFDVHVKSTVTDAHGNITVIVTQG